MGKRKKKYSKGEPPKDADSDVIPPKKEKTESTADAESTEYGGIPMRDLKKNLGCG